MQANCTLIQHLDIAAVLSCNPVFCSAIVSAVCQCNSFPCSRFPASTAPTAPVGCLRLGLTLKSGKLGNWQDEAAAHWPAIWTRRLLKIRRIKIRGSWGPIHGPIPGRNFFVVVENATLMGETHFTHGPKIMELTKVSIIHTLHILR